MTPEREGFLTTLGQIVNEYVMKKIAITVRQLFYQCVAREIISNTMRSYKKVVRDCLAARHHGFIDWESIVDNVRRVDVPNAWDTPGALMEAAADSFFVDRWQDQAQRVEVWTEKDAATSVLSPIASSYRVPFQVNRGYVSASTLWKAAERINEAEWAETGPGDTVILYVGDLDPSGEDMVRDIHDRLVVFECYPTVVKVALTAEQVDQFKLPPNPAKATDSRFRGFVADTGSALSWELDALPPDELQDMCRQAILGWMDRKDTYQKRIKEEGRGRGLIRKAAAKLKGQE